MKGKHCSYCRQIEKLFGRWLQIVRKNLAMKERKQPYNSAYQIVTICRVHAADGHHFTKFSIVYGLLLVREGFRIRHKTRMYIRLFNGDAISQPLMYAHSGSSTGRWTQWPQKRTGFTGADIFYLIMVSR